MAFYACLSIHKQKSLGCLHIKKDERQQSLTTATAQCSCKLTVKAHNTVTAPILSMPKHPNLRLSHPPNPAQPEPRTDLPCPFQQSSSAKPRISCRIRERIHFMSCILQEANC